MMRKLFFLLVLTTLAAVAQKPEIPPDYFPVAEGAVWEYRVTTSMNTTMDIVREIKSVSRQKDGSLRVDVESRTPQVTKMDYTKGGGKVVLHTTEMPTSGYKVDYTAPKLELMNPLKIGSGWDYEGKGSGTKIVEKAKVVKAETVEVPAGKYEAIRVEVDADHGGNKFTLTLWYVNHLGPVKIHTMSAGVESTTELVKYTLPKS